MLSESWCAMRVVVALVLLCALPVSAAPLRQPGVRQVPMDAPISVKLEWKKPTSLTFPENLNHVIALRNTEFTAEMAGAYLVIMSLVPELEGRLFVFGQSGKQYQVDYKIGTPPDVQLVIMASQAATTATKTQPFSDASLLRALRHGTALPDQEPIEMAAPILPDTRVSLMSVDSVALGARIGMVLTVANTSETLLSLDLRVGLLKEVLGPNVVALAQWTLPAKHTVRAVAAEETRLEPQNATRIYLVLERRP